MPASVTALLDKIRALEVLVQSLEGKNGALESALVQHALEIELLQRKLYGTKSEKSGTSELQLLLEGIADTNTLQKLLDDANANKPKSEENEDSDVNQPGPHGGKHGGSKAKPKGRRDLSASKLPHVEVEITDPVLAEKGEVIGHDESRQLLYVRGGFRVLVKRVARYKLAVAASSVAETTVLAATTPPSLCRRSLCHSSVMAFLAHEKFAMGVPHHRLEKHLETEAEPLDRGALAGTSKTSAARSDPRWSRRCGRMRAPNAKCSPPTRRAPRSSPSLATASRSRHAERATSSPSSPTATTSCSTSLGRTARPR